MHGAKKAHAYRENHHFASYILLDRVFKYSKANEVRNLETSNCLCILRDN